MHIPLIDRIICRVIRLEQDQSGPSFAHFARLFAFLLGHYRLLRHGPTLFYFAF
jgi:hypothetical protein